ncbi:MAG: BCD family MFS transporter [Hydrogenophaga sp.]|nr:BCD family MFS transporter [Hydrogenophaga sp.]
MSGAQAFGWGSVARLGLVQASLGAIAVLTTSTLNRVMVVELALPALLPGILVALHYLVQMARPRMGHGSDMGGRRTPWIIGGMAVLGIGGVVAALGTVWMASNRPAGIALAVLGFALVGLGVSASGTSLLVMLAKRVPDARRAGAATLVWMMMIAGFAITAGLAGHWLDPYSPERLLLVSGTVSLLAFALTLVALRGLEGRVVAPPPAAAATERKPTFRQALTQVWSEPVARRFTIFVFVSMLAYSAQDLILEPFAGTVFGYSPGASTQLSGVQHGGVLAGMLLVALSGALAARFAPLQWLGSLRGWTIGGCLASALALLGLVSAGVSGNGEGLQAMVFALGAANGAFSIGAIGSMMRLASQGHGSREGVRMGLWGAAQAIAFGLGGLVGTGASDLARFLIASPGSAYAFVFALEALAFIASAVLAWRISAPQAQPATAPVNPRADGCAMGAPTRLST